VTHGCHDYDFGEVAEVFRKQVARDSCPLTRHRHEVTVVTSSTPRPNGLVRSPTATSPGSVNTLTPNRIGAAWVDIRDHRSSYGIGVVGVTVSVAAALPRGAAPGGRPAAFLCRL